MALQEAEVIKKQKEEPKIVVVNPWLDMSYKKGAPLLTREPGIETIDDLPERLGLLDDETVVSSIQATKFTGLADTPSDYGLVNQFARTDGEGNITWAYPFWKPVGNSIYFRQRVAIGHSHPKVQCHVFKPTTSCAIRIGAKENPWAQWESTDENNGFAAGISDASNKIFKMRYESPIGTASQLFQCFDAGNTRIGAYTASPQVSYHIKVSATSSATYHPNAVLAVESTDNTMIQVSAGTNAGIVFCDATSNPPPGAVIYDHANEWMEITAGGNELLYIKNGWVTTADGIELAVGNFGTPTNPFHVQDEGTTGGWGGAYGGVVARFRASEAKHTSIVIDAQTGYDPVLGLCENGSVIWAIRNDASDTDNFEIRYHVGAANRTDFQITNAGIVNILTNDLTLADGVGLNLQEDITFTGATTENLIKIPDHLAVALDITEASNSYLKFVTTNSGEKVVFGKLFEAPTACKIGNLTLADGSITDSGGTISLGDENLNLTGNLTLGATTTNGSMEFIKGATDNVAYGSCYSTNTGHSNYYLLRKSHNNTIGNVTQTTDGHALGAFWFQGVDAGSAFDLGATIIAWQNGVAGERVPTDLVFTCYGDTSANTNQFVLHHDGNVGIGMITFGTSSNKVLAMGTGVAPSTSIADCFQMYSADVAGAAGKAGVHFRDEAGNVTSIGDGKILDSSGAIAFGDENLSTTGTLGCGAITTDGTFIIDTDTGNQPLYITRLGNTNQSGSMYVDDARLYIQSTQDEATGNVAGIYMRIGSQAGQSSTFEITDYRGGSDSSILKFTTDVNFGLGQTSFGTNATRTYAQSSGTAPTTSPADCFQMYSADQVAGNACAHFRCEGGGIIKVYQQVHIADAVTSHSITDSSETVDRSELEGFLDALGTKINTIYTALENNGLLASA